MPTALHAGALHTPASSPMSMGTPSGALMIPLSILDLAPVTTGSTPAQTFANALDLARAGERLGYRRYWLAEHHNMPGIASAATANIHDHAARVRSFELTMEAWTS